MTEKQMPFLTGSWRYGTPRPDSDVDLVVLMSQDEATLLRAAVIDAGGSVGELEYGDASDTLSGVRFNVIVCTDGPYFAAFRQSADELTARKPVTRDEAIAAHARIRSAMGIFNHYDERFVLQCDQDEQNEAAEARARKAVSNG